VRVEIPGRALRVSRLNFDKLLATEPVVASKLFRALFAETSQRLRDTNEELVAVYEVGHMVAGAADAAQVAEAIVRSLAARLRASYALVAAYDKESNALRVRLATGPVSAGLVGQRIPLEPGGLAARCFDEKRPLLIERLLGATDPWESPSMILAPLVVRDQAVGMLLLGAPVAGGSFRVAELSLAAAVCNISAPILRETF
jgi:GAF domain-containing protein